VAFYYYPNVSCLSSTCQLDIGYSSSTDGGSSWTATTNITGPMTLSWLANTNQGVMVGDYISTSFNSANPDKAFPFFAVATAPTGGKTCGKGHATCHEALNTLGSGVTIQSGDRTSHGDRVVSTAQTTAPSRHTSR
jgi:hypothetical protein